MMHSQIPEFIRADVENGQVTGQFFAASLFVDISGFTNLTGQLMQRGIEGAEILAQMLNEVMGPLIEIVYAQNGFIANMAGDAFIAVFSTASPDVYQRAAIAGYLINQHVSNNPERTTRFGTFQFSIKVALAGGSIQWRVWHNKNRDHISCYFIGDAIDRCLEIEQVTPTGNVFLSRALVEQLPHDVIQTDETDTPHRRLRYVDHALIDSRTSEGQHSPKTNADDDGAIPPLNQGTNQPIGEFRQVVSIFANFQNLWAEQKTEELEQTLGQLVEQYGGHLGLIGRIGPLDKGCTFLFFWGAPTSHENDLSLALNFLLNLRDAAPVPMRAGLTYNLVYAGLVGSSSYTKYTCLGNHVNLAARQFMSAQWGEILLDETTARQVDPEFILSENGWYHFKGFKGQQLVLNLNRKRKLSGPIVFENPIVGRRQELEELWAATQPLWQRRFGGVVTIVGEAGMGKSRLLYELRQHIATRLAPQERPAAQSVTENSNSFTWFHCQTDEIRQQPLNPLKNFIYNYFDQSANQSDETNRRRFNKKLDALIDAITDRQLSDELERIRPLLATMIDLPWQDTVFHQLEPQLRFANTLSALKSLIKAESLRKPVIVCMEDAHWLDKESELFLKMLIRNVESYPFLLLLSTRSFFVEDQEATALDDTKIRSQRNIQLNRAHKIIELDRLNKSSINMLATYHLEGATSPALVDLLVEQSDGVPFFAEQLLLYWQEHDYIQWGDQGWQLSKKQTAQFSPYATRLPADARAVLTARLDRLPADVKDIVKRAAVLGREFDIRVLARLVHSKGKLRRQLAKAEKLQIWSAQTSTVYLFNHELLRNAAYEMQLRSQVRNLHHRAIAAIERVYARELNKRYAALIYHSRCGGDAAKERHYALLAGQSAADQYANEEALQYVNCALDLTQSADYESQVELLLMRERICDILGDRNQQAQDFAILSRLIHTVEDRAKQADYLERLALYYRVTNQYEEALSTLETLKPLAIELNDPATLITYHIKRGRVFTQMGNYSSAKTELNRSLMLAQEANITQSIFDSLSHLGNIDYYESNYHIAQSRFDRALALYQSAGYPKGEVNCLYMNSVIAYKFGNYTEAQQQLLNALEISWSIGWRHGETLILGQLGNNYFELGNYQLAQTHHLRALNLCQEINDLEGEAVSLDTLGLIAHFRNNLKGAHRQLQKAREIQKEIGDKRGLAYTLTHIGFTQISMGRLAAARAAFEEAIALRKELGETAAMIDSRAGLATVDWHQQNLHQAAKQALEIVKWIKANDVDAIEFPIHVCHLCFRILQSCAHTSAAQTALQIGYDIVQSRASKIQDSSIQRMFLHNVPFNREIIAHWEKFIRASKHERKAVSYGSSTEQQVCAPYF